MNSKQPFLQEKSRYAKIEAPCKYFGVCGGCSLQDLAYDDQIRLKKKSLEDLFKSIALHPSIQWTSLPNPWRYRNKAEFTFGSTDSQLSLGYHKAGSFTHIVDLRDCHLLPETLMRVVNSVREIARKTNLPVYQPRTHQGVLRYLIVRTTPSTGKIMLCLMTTSGPREQVESMIPQIVKQHQSVSSIYWGTTDKVADIAAADELFHLYGDEYLEDQVGPFHIQLHPFSFLQPSTHQAQRLYQMLSDIIPDDVNNIAWDLYCGVGLIAFYLSRRFRKVYGIDVETHNLQLAKRNAVLNSISNVEFHEGKVESLLRDKRFWLLEAKPDLVAVDPPRAGLHKQAISSLLAARPKYVIYCSCNAQSLVRDLYILKTSFPSYRLERVHAFDMFPQTNHFETLCLLKR